MRQKEKKATQKAYLCAAFFYNFAATNAIFYSYKPIFLSTQ
jgi:hypothetical protein